MSNKFCIINCETSEIEKFKNLFEENLEYTCIGVSDNYNASLTLILKFLPNIVLVDIDKKINGSLESPLQMVQELFQYLDYTPIFIALSSSKEKAYDVIKLGFFDYLIKPVNELDSRRWLFLWYGKGTSFTELKGHSLHF